MSPYICFDGCYSHHKIENENFCGIWICPTSWIGSISYSLWLGIWFDVFMMESSIIGALTTLSLMAVHLNFGSCYIFWNNIFLATSALQVQLNPEFWSFIFLSVSSNFKPFFVDMEGIFFFFMWPTHVRYM